MIPINITQTSNGVKAIFITSFHPLIARNILATSILEHLLEHPAVQVVLLVPANREDFFKGEFRHPRIVVETVTRNFTWVDAVLRSCALAALHTRSLAIKQRTELWWGITPLSKLIPDGRFSRSLLRSADRFFSPRGRFRDLLDRYRPSLVFATDVQNGNDVRLMHEARDRKIPVVGMVRSWDNLTSKGIIRVIPDALLVWNELLKEEAKFYQDIPEEKIRVVGIPHYDGYVRGARISREAFFQKIGGDPKKRLILFAPVGDRYIHANTVDREILEVLLGAAPLDCEILVRFPPQDTVSFDGFKNDGRVMFERPKNSYTNFPKKTELTREMDTHLADTLYHSDLVISGPSTMCIDAAIFNKPMILVGFDGAQARPYHESLRRYFDYEHQKNVLESGGAKLAKTPKEFAGYIRSYLENHKLDEAGRKRIVKEECFLTDGKSSERVVKELLLLASSAR